MPFSNDVYNVQVAHEETTACRFPKIITCKLLMKRPPLVVFQKKNQKEIAMILAENKIFVKENHKSILPEEITYLKVHNKCIIRPGRDFTGENHEIAYARDNNFIQE